MSKGKKRCYFCRCDLNNQNATQIIKTERGLRTMIWLDCCHGCKSKQDKKP
jgi:hypothetical protein